jgi:hypothetical protein
MLTGKKIPFGYYQAEKNLFRSPSSAPACGSDFLATKQWTIACISRTTLE